MSSPLTRSTGAAREWKKRSETRAAISAPIPAKPCASASTTARPVRRTDAATVTADVRSSAVLRLPAAATHVALHWAGRPDAVVQVAFSTDGSSFTAPVDAGRVLGAGLLVAGLSALVPVLVGGRIGQSYALDIDAPLLGQVHIGTNDGASNCSLTEKVLQVLPAHVVW